MELSALAKELAALDINAFLLTTDAGEKMKEAHEADSTSVDGMERHLRFQTRGELLNFLTRKGGSVNIGRSIQQLSVGTDYGNVKTDAMIALVNAGITRLCKTNNTDIDELIEEKTTIEDVIRAIQELPEIHQ